MNDDFPTQPCKKCGGKQFYNTCVVRYALLYDLDEGECGEYGDTRLYYAGKYWACTSCRKKVME